MKTDMSGITKALMQVKGQLQAGAAADRKEEKLSASFFELMNQSVSLPDSAASSASGELVYRVEAAGKDGGATQAAYDTYANPAKNVSVRENVPPEEALLESPELMEEYEDKIRAVLKEQFGVSDEEIDQVLQLLGLGILDLGNIQDLTAFVQELTGEDIGALFLSEVFLDVKNTIMEATETLCAELGITKEELDALAETLRQQMQSTGEETILPSEEGAAVEEAGVETIGQENAVQPGKPVTEDVVKETETAPQKGQETVTVPVQETKDPQADLPQEEADETESKAEMPIQKGNGSNQQEADSSQNPGSGEKGQELPQEAKSAAFEATNAHVGTAVPDGQAFKAEIASDLQETPAPYANQVDTMEIIEQIARQVRVTVSAETTSMEMQLNPENLGKIYLNITEKEGAVRAQIAAQNQVVKEALETQVAELRHTLSQQGIKVDAIEVTVASHEFEQNLEQNARQEEQMHEQMQQAKDQQARRNLNLSELDELSGLMTEEEQLVAQIMRDNGNQVDLTA